MGPMGPMGPVGIPWEWESLIASFMGMGMRMGIASCEWEGMKTPLFHIFRLQVADKPTSQTGGKGNESMTSRLGSGYLTIPITLTLNPNLYHNSSTNTNPDPDPNHF